ncbi:hypothetical protein CCP3SC1AL1_1690005 [Gammaproteobacteria bacterium]
MALITPKFKEIPKWKGGQADIKPATAAPADTPAVIGRPRTPFDPDKAYPVLNLVEKGMSFEDAAKESGFKLSLGVFWNWCFDAENCPDSPQHAAFALEVSRARKNQAASFFDQCFKIANDSSKDLIQRIDKHGTPQDTPNPVAVARAKLMIDTRLRLAELIDPERYAVSKRIDVTSNGESVTGAPSAPTLDAAKRRIMQELTGEDRVKAVIDLAKQVSEDDLNVKGAKY